MRNLREKIQKAEQMLTFAKERYDYQKSVIPTQIHGLKPIFKQLTGSLSLHAIQINPELLEPLHGQEAIRITNHGAITRNLLHKCLKIANGKPS